jgi:hypothetical protein
MLTFQSRSAATIALFLAAVLAAPGVLQSQQTWIPFEGTASPDGRYCLAWGMVGVPLDASDPDKLIQDLDPDTVENYLVDLKTGEPIAILGSTHFAVGDIAKNRGSLTAIWRKDSRAILAEEAARFGSELVMLIEIVDPEHPYDPCSDVILLTKALQRAARERMLRKNPDEGETIQDFAISFFPVEWTGERTVRMNVIGEIPKDEEAHFFEEEVVFELPEIRVGLK